MNRGGGRAEEEKRGFVFVGGGRGGGGAASFFFVCVCVVRLRGELVFFGCLANRSRASLEGGGIRVAVVFYSTAVVAFDA